MAPETGPLVAGALVATTISPLRSRTEKIVNRLVLQGRRPLKNISEPVACYALRKL